jgi:hypothetical protein
MPPRIRSFMPAGPLARPIQAAPRQVFREFVATLQRLDQPAKRRPVNGRARMAKPRRARRQPQ